MAGPKAVRRNFAIEGCGSCGGDHTGITIMQSAGRHQTFRCPTTNAVADPNDVAAVVVEETEPEIEEVAPEQTVVVEVAETTADEVEVTEDHDGAEQEGEGTDPVDEVLA